MTRLKPYAMRFLISRHETLTVSITNCSSGRGKWYFSQQVRLMIDRKAPDYRSANLRRCKSFRLTVNFQVTIRHHLWGLCNRPQVLGYKGRQWLGKFLAVWKFLSVIPPSNNKAPELVFIATGTANECSASFWTIHGDFSRLGIGFWRWSFS